MTVNGSIKSSQDQGVVNETNSKGAKQENRYIKHKNTRENMAVRMHM